MKKTWIAMFLVVALCLSLVACTQPAQPEVKDDPQVQDPAPVAEDPAPAPETEAPAVPTEEGKITFMFTLSDAAVEQPEFVNYFLTGGFNGFATGYDAVRLENLEGTKIYYAITDAVIDPAAEQGCDFQLKIGYNETAGAPASQQGLTWSNEDWKSDECAAPGGLNNLKFEYAAGQQIVDLGVHTFSTVATAPVTVSTTLVLRFDQPLPEGAQVGLYGGFNDWTDGNFMTSEDNQVFKYAVNDAVTQAYEFKAVVYKPGEYETVGQWGGGSQIGASGEMAPSADNASVTIDLVDNGEELELFDHEIVYTDIVIINSLTATVTFDKALAEGSFVYAYGDFNNWGPNGGHEFASEDGITWKLVINQLPAGDHQFKVLVYAPGTTEFTWDNPAKLLDDGEGNNIVFNFTAEMDGTEVAIFEAPVAAE